MRLPVWLVLIFLQSLGPAGPAARAASEMAVQFQEGLLWAEVTISQRREPLHFLVDSGASASVLSLGRARELGLKLGSKVRVSGVNGVSSGRWPVRLSARASQLALPGEFLALDLGKLSRACGRSVDGLIGADFFRGRVVEIDYLARKLRLLESAPPGHGTNAIPMQVGPGGFRVPVNVDGGECQWVRVDTGCATAFHWVGSKEGADLLAPQGAVGLAELSIPQTVTGLRIGNHYLATVPTGLHRQAIFPGEAGLMGNGLLARFGVAILDAKSGRLFLGGSGSSIP